MSSATPLIEVPAPSKKQVAARLHKAVRRHKALTPSGLSEQLFAKVFSGLVYAQIWEDPEVDMNALQIQPGNRIVTIASGGCNALSYLLADPASVEAVDLNRTHVAFNRLKFAALASLPDYTSFLEFYGGAGSPRNLSSYQQYVRPNLDDFSRDYWESRGLSGRRRISMFSRGLYRHGLLGRFIGAGHRVARLYGVDLNGLLKATTLEEQRAFFDGSIAPLFEKRLVRWATKRKSSLYGLGIPPQQYESLATSGDGMASILRARLERLACDFPLSENYFAWQAFGRAYAADGAGPLPPYLRRDSYETVKSRVNRVSITNTAFHEFLGGKAEQTVDRFILLDAQDWMSDAQLNELWGEITRTAAPGARVIFRTAASESVLPGRLAPDFLSRWDYREQESLAFHARDRSAIYGGFHLYVLRG